jgi:hypothetical protein
MNFGKAFVLMCRGKVVRHKSWGEHPGIKLVDMKIVDNQYGNIVYFSEEANKDGWEEVTLSKKLSELMPGLKFTSKHLPSTYQKLNTSKTSVSSYKYAYFDIDSFILHGTNDDIVVQDVK